MSWPLNVCMGCIDAVEAPRRASGASTRWSSAPLVCNTILPRQLLEPFVALSAARFRATLLSAPSGVDMRMAPALRTSGCSFARAVPAPIARTAARELAEERVTTVPIRQPSLRRRAARACPTRPAPMMEIVRVMQRDSITCSLHSRWRKF